MSMFIPTDCKPELETATAALQISTVHWVKLTGCKKQHLEHHKQNHGITVKVGRDLKDHPIQLSTHHPHNPPKAKSPNATSRHLLKNFRDTDSTTSWGNLFQCPTTLPGNFFLLICLVSFSSGTMSCFF